VWLQIPGKLFVAPMDRAVWKALFANTPLLLTVSVTAIQVTGVFMVFSYMAPILKDFIAAPPTVISMVFLCFGITGVIGNVIAARIMDRIGTVRVGMAAMGSMLTAIVLWPLTRGSTAITAVLILIWGLGGFSIYSAQQARLVELAPRLASASIALNSSATYFGQAVDAFVGGIIIASQGTANLSLYSAVPMILAMAVSLLAANMSNRRMVAKAP
jgi:predicted MFS family arabinose efflux permease